MPNVLPPADALDVARKGLFKKATERFSATAISASFAGAMIAFGFVFYITTQVGLGEFPTGIAKLIGGMTFSSGLFMTIVLGLDLFTSTTMTTVPAADRKLGVGRMFSHWTVVYFANMIGALAVVALIWFSGLWEQGSGEWGATLLSMAAAKTSRTWIEAFTLGILCNILVCLGAWIGFHGKTVVDKFFGVLWPVALFVAAGFEHSIANMFILPLGMLIKTNPEIAAAAGDVSSITLGNVVIANLIPVTLGNIVGGSVIGLGLRAWQKAAAKA